MKNKKVFIEVTEFQRKVFDYIGSEQLSKMFDTTYFSKGENKQECKMAMIHGMLIASMITSRCDLYHELEINRDNNE